MQKQRFLVGRLVDGAFRKASDSGYLYGGVGACHPLVDGMTEADHQGIVGRPGGWRRNRFDRTLSS